MKLTDFFLDELAREAIATRKVLERVPAASYDWKPHPRSMSLGQLSNLVASMVSWIGYTIELDELDIAPVGAKGYEAARLDTPAALIAAHDAHLEKARAVLQATTDEHLMKDWKLLAGGHVMSTDPRWVFLRDSIFNHQAHHRGQLTVYLRLNEAMVPAIYGPTADERS